MNDTDLLDSLRGSLTDVRMTVPFNDIVTTGQTRRRRRVLGYAGAVTAMGALVAVITVGAANGPTRPAHPYLTAFTVATQTDGATTLTLLKGDQYRLDPDALSRALSDHGIPAIVRVNTTCDSDPSPQSGLDQVVTEQRTTQSAVTLTINPSALAAGEELSIGYYPNHTTWGLAYQNTPLNCQP
jgi:hypothetical protein